MQSSPRIDELRQKFHENPRRYFAPLANEYRKAGDPEQAIAICRAHLAQQPGHMSGHVVYGQALYDAGRMDEAAVVFHEALALDPENIIVLRHLGDIARQRGDVDEARSWYSRALDGDPHDAEIAAYLAELTEPLTTAPQAHAEVQAQPEARVQQPEAQVQQPEAQVQQQPEADAEPQPEAHAEPQTQPYLESQAETGVPSGDATGDVPETAAESAAVEEVALEDAESEGLAVAAPTASPEPEPTPQAESEGDFSEWPESAIEPETVFNVFETEETHGADELISPYAREMELAAPSEMKWDLNESPYLELVESSASDDAWDSVRTEPREPEAAIVDSPEHAEEPAASIQSSSESPPAAEPSEAVAVGADQQPAPPVPEAEPPADTPARKTPSRSTPVSETAPIVTRTLAELYLQQGYIEPALEIYRQLAEQEPDDRGLQARIDEISTDVESIAVRDEEDAAAERAAADDSQEEPEPPPVASESTASVDAETTSEPESTVASAPTDELWDSADSWGDRPFTDAEDRDEIFGLPDDVASAEEEVPEPDPEPFVAPRVMTVREFFATLGSARPPVRDVEQPAAAPESAVTAAEPEPEPEPAEESSEPEEYPIADDAFANLFAGVPANAEDSRAAAVLSGAVAHGAPFATPPSTPTSPPPRVVQQNREGGPPAEESEEDLRRFREWLDGLADS